MRKVIKDWADLAALPNESATHVLTVDVKHGNAYLSAKNPKRFTEKKSFMRQIVGQDVYLSTHSFYKEEYKKASKVLRACGFNVELECWEVTG